MSEQTGEEKQRGREGGRDSEAVKCVPGMSSKSWIFRGLPSKTAVYSWKNKMRNKLKRGENTEHREGGRWRREREKEKGSLCTR